MPTGLSQARQARLFNQIFKFSRGNIGTALLCWVAHIHDFKNDTIFVRTPRLPDLDILDELSLELKLILMQFILHQRLSVKSISILIQEQEEQVAGSVDFLVRSGLLHEQADGIYEMNVYAHFHLMKYLLNEFDTKDKQ